MRLEIGSQLNQVRLILVVSGSRFWLSPQQSFYQLSPVNFDPDSSLSHNDSPQNVLDEFMLRRGFEFRPTPGQIFCAFRGHIFVRASFNRSEEHTSELQSPCNLVC